MQAKIVICLSAHGRLPMPGHYRTCSYITGARDVLYGIYCIETLNPSLQTGGLPLPFLPYAPVSNAPLIVYFCCYVYHHVYCSRPAAFDIAL